MTAPLSPTQIRLTAERAVRAREQGLVSDDELRGAYNAADIRMKEGPESPLFVHEPLRATRLRIAWSFDVQSEAGLERARLTVSQLIDQQRYSEAVAIAESVQVWVDACAELSEQLTAQEVSRLLKRKGVG